MNRLIRAGACLSLSMLALTSTATKASSAASQAEVQKAYVAYYGRPGDQAGLEFWAGLMDEQGGRLDVIIDAFGTSPEFDRRYGGLDSESLITAIYQQTLNRAPDPAGLDFYSGNLEGGTLTLQTITLDVLNGATTPPDSDTVANKLSAADHYTAAWGGGCNLGNEDEGVAYLTAVTSDPASVSRAMDAVDTQCGTALTSWRVLTHPCAGNRTDALWCDTADQCFVGCGTTTDGFGLFLTEDGGASWTAPPTNPAGFFETMRVNTISRSDDGLLYIGGTRSGSNHRVVSMDGEGELFEVLNAGTTIDTSFSVGTFRRAGGQAMAESLTGVQVLYRGTDAADPIGSWQNGYGWWDDPFGYQILDMEVHEGQFYGCGSTISQPPQIFLPAWDDQGFGFEALQLATGLQEYSGEMWGLDVNDDGIAVGGVDQDRDVGMVYTHSFASGDAANLGNWMVFDVSTLFPNNTTWVQDVCRGSGDRIYIVGRESSQGWGFVLQSTDGGASYSDITEYLDGASTFSEVYRCQAIAGGVIVAGQNGFFGVYSSD